MVGKTLGHYEILEPLGAGGMGEVYRARDTKLDRHVAIKVLPEDFATDPDRLARFEREAKLLASLNHANIAAIYGLEDEGDQRFIVMEVVEGETLAEHIASSGRIEVDEALDIARQIAEALEAAHENGVIHRDLKPANVIVTPDGKAKVLDFGLAKAYEADGSAPEISPDLSHSPTMMAAATRTGVIMGTAAYMSPEQARGKPVDKRTDIWAFGCVMFEMLTGKRAFQGETVTDILAAIVHQEPQWEALPPETPARIRDLLRRCLKKQADERLRDVGECRIAVNEYLADPEGEKRRALASAGTTAARGISWKLAAPIAIGLMVVVAMTTWFIARPAREPNQVVRFDIPLPAGASFETPAYQIVAISPNGSEIVFSTADGLLRRKLDEAEATPLPGTSGALAPFFSRDGRQVGFWADGQVKRISVAGGAPVSIGPSDPVFGATWTDDDTILVGQADPPGIFSVPATGGQLRQIVQVEQGEQVYGPQLLPGAEWILFTLRPAGAATWDESSIVAQELSTGERRELVPGARDGRYVSSGHIVYYQNGSILAVEFDAANVKARGETVSMVQGVAGSAGETAVAQFATSDGGALVYVPGDPGGVSRNLVWVDQSGDEDLVGAPPGDYWWVDLSPDGDMIAVTRVDEGARDIYTWNIGNATLARLTTGGMDFLPRFSSDGSMVAFASGRPAEEAGRNVYVIPIDASASATLLHDTADHLYPASWTRDGRLVLLARSGATISGGNDTDDIVVLSADGQSLEDLVAVPGFNENAAALSPDDQWLAYISNDSGDQVWVRRFPGPSGRTAVSPSGAHSPRWSADARTIFYVYDGAMWAASMQFDSAASVLDRERLFDVGGYRMDHFGSHTYAVHPDGRFLFVTNPLSGGVGAVPHVKVVLNWFEELKERVPTGR